MLQQAFRDWTEPLKNPIEWVQYLTRKLFLDRVRYARGDAYRAEEYWRDRFNRYGASSRGPGHEGRSEAENDRMYEAAVEDLDTLLGEIGVWRRRPSVLEVGPGTGVWTSLCRDRGVTDYTGLDITDARFKDLKERFPGFHFVQGNACVAVPAGRFSLVICIDVIEHVVTEPELLALLSNLRQALAPGGHLVLAFPPWSAARVNLYYLRFWPEGIVLAGLRPLELIAQGDFRVGQLYVLESPND